MSDARLLSWPMSGWVPPLPDAAKPDQVVRRKRPRHPAAHLGQRNHRQLVQSADGLDPAEALLDALAYLQTHRIALAARLARIDGAASALGVARNVGLDASKRKRLHEVVRA